MSARRSERNGLCVCVGRLELTLSLSGTKRRHPHTMRGGDQDGGQCFACVAYRNKYATVGSLYELKSKRRKKQRATLLGSTTCRLINNVITHWSLEGLCGAAPEQAPTPPCQNPIPAVRQEIQPDATLRVESSAGVQRNTVRLKPPPVTLTRCKLVRLKSFSHLLDSLPLTGSKSLSKYEVSAFLRCGGPV